MTLTTTPEEKLERYYRNLPKYLNPRNNIPTYGLLKAWAGGDSDVENAIYEAKDQLFVARADGIYLDRLAANCGIERPESLYLDDDTFRELIPLLCHGDVGSRGGLSEIIDVLYGEDAQRAHCISQNPETYRMVQTQDLTGDGTGSGTFEVDDITDIAVDYELEIESDTQSRLSVTVTAVTGASAPYTIEVDSGGTDLSSYLVSENAYIRTGETLTVENDQGTETIRFPSSAFADNDLATVEELVDYYNDNMTLTTASVEVDTGVNYFQIRTNTVGASGWVLISSGTANNVLNFDTETRCQNAEIIIYEPGDEDGVIIDAPDDTSIVTRDLRGSWHMRADETIVDSRPTISSADPFYPGPFIASPATDGLILSTTCTLQEDIAEGELKNSLMVDDSSSFPDETGTITVSFGTGDEEGPFTYSGRPSNTVLLINPARSFEKAHLTGETINLSTTPDTDGLEDYGSGFYGYKPRDDGSDYSAFVTDPLTISIVLSEILEDVTDAGIPVAIQSESLVYRWAEL